MQEFWCLYRSGFVESNWRHTAEAQQYLTCRWDLSWVSATNNVRGLIARLIVPVFMTQELYLPLQTRIYDQCLHKRCRRKMNTTKLRYMQRCWARFSVNRVKANFFPRISILSMVYRDYVLPVSEEPGNRWDNSRYRWKRLSRFSHFWKRLALLRVNKLSNRIPPSVSQGHMDFLSVV